MPVSLRLLARLPTVARYHHRDMMRRLGAWPRSAATVAPSGGPCGSRMGLGEDWFCKGIAQWRNEVRRFLALLASMLSLSFPLQAADFRASLFGIKSNGTT